MHLQRLHLVHFKNYDQQELTLSPQLNCFVGENGMGKTNLLDAIHYLCMCKSHFSLPDRQVLQHGADFFRIEGDFEREGKIEAMVCTYAPRLRKKLLRNKVPYKRLADHIGFLPLIMIAPDDTLLITEGSENRRQFLDVLLVQLDPTYLQQLMTYNKVLQQRNAYLKSFKHPLEMDGALLETYNQQLLAPAQYIHEQRQQIVRRLTPVFQQYYKIISGDREQVSLFYQSQLTTQTLVNLLAESQEKDTWLQRTTKGIHKDDLKLLINEYAVKKFASQGQLKSYLLALKLAQYELLRQEVALPPVLLLDDIFDKLDSKRVEQLLTLLLERDFGQVFLTDTHESRIARIVQGLQADFKQFVVEDGTVCE
ncbi:MAG: DNA replication/repair protein RecF [Aureispira sp.]